MSEPTGSPVRRPRAVRLLFTYSGGQPRLLSQQPVDAVAPPSLPLDDGDEATGTGFWAEVRTTDGRVEHRQRLNDPTGAHIEVFSPPPERSVVRAPAPGRRVVFGVLVPVTDDSDHVALLGPAGDVGGYPGGPGIPGGPGSHGVPGAVPAVDPPAAESDARELTRVALDPAAGGAA